MRVRGRGELLLLDGGAGRDVEDEGEVDGGDGDEVRGVEEAELRAVGVVDDEPETGRWELGCQGRETYAYHAICIAPSWSSSLPSPVPQ